MSNWKDLNKFHPLCSSVFPLVKEEQLDDGTWDSFSTSPLGCFHVPIGWLGVVGWHYPHPLVLCPRLTLKGCETHLSCPFGNSPNEDSKHREAEMFTPSQGHGDHRGEEAGSKSPRLLWTKPRRPTHDLVCCFPCPWAAHLLT